MGGVAELSGADEFDEERKAVDDGLSLDPTAEMSGKRPGAARSGASDRLGASDWVRASDRVELSRFFPYQLAVLATRVSKRLQASYLEIYDLNVSEWRVIAHVAWADRVSIREIHLRASLDKPTVSRAVKRLVDAAILRREPSRIDRRLIEISLTEKGRGIYEEISKTVLPIEAEILSALAPEEQRMLSDLFDKLHARLDADPLAPPRPPLD